MLKFSNLKISKNYLITFFTEFIILILSLLIYKIAALNLGTTGFSEYSLSRRSFSFLQPIFSLGIGVGISRYIAFNNEKINNYTDTYFVSGVIILFTVNIIFSILINIFNTTFSYLLFGDIKYYIFIFPISIMLIGSICHFVCYSYFRGKLMLVKANILQLINIGIAPFLIILFYKSIATIILITGILWILISLIFFGIIVFNKLNIKKNCIYSCGKELFYYGFQRIPGDILLTGFLSLPAFFVSHTNGIIMAGYVAFGMSVLNMIGALFAPLGQVLLPEASKLIATNNLKSLKIKSMKILKWTFFITLFGLVISEILMKQIIMIYLGEKFSDSILIVRIIILGSLGYTIYISLRSLLDAFYVKAMNTLNIFYSFALWIVLSLSIYYFYNNYIIILATFVVSILFLGLLTVLETLKIFKPNSNSNKLFI